jgi:hypothetical protein
MIHGAITIRSLPVILTVQPAGVPGRWSCCGDRVEPGLYPRPARASRVPVLCCGIMETRRQAAG